MAPSPHGPTPVHLITGFLGAGKTTALRHLLAHRPAGETWAVVVNELGDLGVDGALIRDALGRDDPADAAVAELAGGCICCAAGPVFTDTLTGLLDRHRPHRVLVEPSGGATPAALVDTLRTGPLASRVRLGAVIALVDPRRYADTTWRHHPVLRQQLETADVVLASRTDLARPQDVDALLTDLRGWFPPKRHLGRIAHGRLDPSLLDLPAAPPPRFRRPPSPDAHPDDVRARSWSFPPRDVFDAHALARWLDTATWPGPLLRVKAVLRTTEGWLAVNATAEQRAARPTDHRRDSRIEVLVGPPAASGGADRTEAAWSRLDATLRACRLPVPRPTGPSAPSEPTSS